jgi:hypothetical protein
MCYAAHTWSPRRRNNNYKTPGKKASDMFSSLRTRYSGRIPVGSRCEKEEEAGALGPGLSFSLYCEQSRGSVRTIILVSKTHGGEDAPVGSEEDLVLIYPQKKKTHVCGSTRLTCTTLLSRFSQNPSSKFRIFLTHLWLNSHLYYGYSTCSVCSIISLTRFSRRKGNGKLEIMRLVFLRIEKKKVSTSWQLRTTYHVHVTCVTSWPGRHKWVKEASKETFRFQNPGLEKDGVTCLRRCQ